MTDKTLPERMREAAEVQCEVAARRGVNDSEYAAAYTSFSLRALADQFEREDAEKAAAEVDALAEVIYREMYPGSTPAAWSVEENVIRNAYRAHARAVIAAGWQKQATP